MEKYVPLLNEFDTQNAIALVKDKFATELCDSLDLSRVSAPLFVAFLPALSVSNARQINLDFEYLDINFK